MQSPQRISHSSRTSRSVAPIWLIWRNPSIPAVLGMKKESSLSHYNSMNVLSMHALIGAYSDEGSQWVDELREVLTENVKYACKFIRKNLPGVSVQQPEGTYMLFLDCEEYCRRSGRTLDEVKKAGYEVGVVWQDGRPFHGAHHIRMNLALPMEKVIIAMDRLKEYVFI